MIRRPPRSTRTDTLFPYTTLFRSERVRLAELVGGQVITHVKLPCSFPTTHPLFIGETGWKLSEPILKRLKDSDAVLRSEEHTSELQSLMRISYAVFCLKKKTKYFIH